MADRFLSTQDLTNLRAIQADARTSGGDTCTIRRGTVTYTGPGTADPVFADLATGVTCRVSIREVTPREAANQGDADFVWGTIAYFFSLPYDQDITRKDRVVFGSETYEVLGVLNVGALMIDKEAICVWIDV
jgi:hypothetical protein|tara:strand:- start:2321 stop:2716 length:396 start_codon:yes stop_codon:yes gene_type:complete